MNTPEKKELSPEVFISEEEISKRIKELGKEITKEYQGKKIVVVCVLKGAVLFCSELIKRIDAPIRLEFIKLSSYGDSFKSAGTIKLDFDLTGPIEGEDVLVVEDIVDTGLTINYLLNHLASKKPKSVKLVSLLIRPNAFKHEVNVDHYAFLVKGKEFIIGYGLDMAQFCRGIPYLGTINDSD